MQIHSLYTYNDLRNFTYALEMQDKSCLILDPWDADQVNDFLRDSDLRLTTIINTHEHWDHTRGNEALVSMHGCEVWAHVNGKDKIPGLTRTLEAGEAIELDPNIKILVMDTPGHTFAHLCFQILEGDQPFAVFTGDTLFNAGVGNCFNGGDPQTMYNTISGQFHTLPDSVKVYPGHEYLENNLRFTLNFESANEDAKAWLSKAEKVDPGKNPLRTTIGDERLINTFFRLQNFDIRESLEMPDAADRDVFVALRAKRDKW
jgi:hydroxyacylglutathione hydrolase